MATYSITNHFPSNLTVDKQEAEEGETVTVTLTAEPTGTGSTWLYVKNDTANEYIINQQAVTLNTPVTFAMPAGNVSVSVSRFHGGGGND